MGFRGKLFVLFCLACLLPIVAFGLYARVIALQNMQQLELNLISRQKAVVFETMYGVAEKLLALGRDYGEWDELYDAVKRGDLPWIEENVTRWLPETYGIDIVILTNASGQVIATSGITPDDAKEFLKSDFAQKPLNNQSVAGLLTVRNVPAMFSAYPVMQSDGAGPRQGCLYLGDNIDLNLCYKLSKSTGDNWSLHYLGPVRLAGSTDPASVLTALRNFEYKNKLAAATAPREESAAPEAQQGEQVILPAEQSHSGIMPNGTSFSIIPFLDTHGQPVLTFTVIMNRDYFSGVLVRLDQALVFFIILSIFFSGIISIFLAQGTLRRFSRIVDAADRIASGDCRGVDLELKGSDTLSHLEASLATIINQLGCDIQDKCQENRQLDVKRRKAEEESITDALTGLYNYRFFENAIMEIVKACHTRGGTTAVLMFDLDYFKEYNDTHGHPAGNQLLRWISQRLREVIRETDIIVRYGGDEFFIGLIGSDREGAKIVARKIMGVLAEGPDASWGIPYPAPLTASIGIAVMPEDAQEKNELVQIADSALYQAKRSGRNCIGTPNGRGGFVCSRPGPETLEDIEQ